MFFQILTEHQGHLLIAVIVGIGLPTAFLPLFRLFNKKKKNANLAKMELLNFDEQGKRKSKKRWGKSKVKK